MFKTLSEAFAQSLISFFSLKCSSAKMDCFPTAAYIQDTDIQDGYESDSSVDLLGPDPYSVLIRLSIRHRLNYDFEAHKTYFLGTVWIEYLEVLFYQATQELPEPTLYDLAKDDLGFSLEDELSLSAFGYFD
jgi:hypothetical protein